MTFIGGLPCAFLASIALSRVDGWVAVHSARISTFIYTMSLVLVLARQSDRFLPKALEEFNKAIDGE